MDMVVLVVLTHMEVLEINMEYPSYNTPPAGSIRFNTDSSKMEIYNGDKWWEIESYTGSGRGLFMGGSPSPDTIDYITIDSTGDAVDFGNLTEGRMTGGAVASQTRAVYVAGEKNPSGQRKIHLSQGEARHRAKRIGSKAQ